MTMNEDLGGSAGMGGLGLADVLSVMGLGLVAAGCWGLWGWAAAALVVGVLLLAGGVVGAVRETQGEGEGGTQGGTGE